MVLGAALILVGGAVLYFAVTGESPRQALATLRRRGDGLAAPTADRNVRRRFGGSE